MYEAQISDLRCHLETAVQEKNELEASRAKFDSMSSEFESRYFSFPICPLYTPVLKLFHLN